MSDIVVSREWVAGHLGDEGFVVVDVRDPWEFDGIGHIPGAVNVPFEEYRSEFEGEAGHLPGADVFSALLSTAGITNEDHLVAYDDTHGVFAARFVVTAELYGHDRSTLHLLDGDFSAWSREHEVSTDAPERDAEADTASDAEAGPASDAEAGPASDAEAGPASDAEADTASDAEAGPTSGDDAAPGRYEAVFQTDGPLVDLEDVRAAMADPDAILVDTREDWEYEEGHIPGAVRLDWRELVDEESRGLKPREELEAILADRGIRRDRRVVLYCNTARRISHTYVVLRYLDYEDLAFYEGSLTEWERAGGEVEHG